MEFRQFENDYNQKLQNKSAISFQPDSEMLLNDVESMNINNNIIGREKFRYETACSSYGDLKCPPSADQENARFKSLFDQFGYQLSDNKRQLIQQARQRYYKLQQQQKPQSPFEFNPLESLQHRTQHLSRSFSENRSLVKYGSSMNDIPDSIPSSSSGIFTFGNRFGPYNSEQQNNIPNELNFSPRLNNNPIEPHFSPRLNNNPNESHFSPRLYQNNNPNSGINLNENLPSNNMNNNNTNIINDNTISEITESCSRHGDKQGYFFCKTCEVVLCSICFMEGVCATHEYIDLTTLHVHQTETLRSCGTKTKYQLSKLQDSEMIIDRLETHLRKRYEEAIKSIEKTHATFLQTLLERKEEIFTELEKSYTTKLSRIHESKSLISSNIGELNDAEVLIDTLLPLPFNSKLVSLKYEVVQKIEELVNFRFELKELSDAVASLNFYSNRQGLKLTIKNAFGFVGSVAMGERNEFLETRQQVGSGRNAPVEPIILDQKTAFYNEPIAKPNPDHQINRQSSSAEPRNETTGSYPCLQTSRSSYAVGEGLLPTGRSKFFGNQMQSSACQSPLLDGARSDSCSSRSSLYQGLLTSSSQNLIVGSNLGGLSADEMSKSIFPTFNIGHELRRIKMEYHCKFGEFGSEPGQFTEPSGVAVGRGDEILVADANNHRIQAFDSSGVFKRIIGQDFSKPGHEIKGQCEGDLVYPNRLAVNKITGEIYVTERSPTHQVRVYEESGHYMRRFGAHVLQHPRGITVDKLGRIIVIECKVMRVVIFNSTGSVLNRFVIEKKVNFPNGVAVNDLEEIFISDNRRHGIVVFDYQGIFLRTIGGIGVTNYPIGVGINLAGEVVVADNHNNFNVTLFTQEGKLIRALESRVKHAQCFDTALMDNGSIVLSSKDFRIYIYHYAQYQQVIDESSAINEMM